MPIQLQAIGNHVWQSTLFAAAVGLLVVVCRRFGPRVRYGLWLAASAKFLMPFSILSLESVLLHEMAHVRRRDNLTGLIHRVVEMLFWFHPLIWWIGARLHDERERACDEDVLCGGIAPKAYAESILRICELYLESPLPFASVDTQNRPLMDT